MDTEETDHQLPGTGMPVNSVGETSPPVIDITAKQPEPGEQTITNDKPETSVMEVHHHPQVEKKNFKEYFLEFLMIFLAVTLGFFAETIRETITEHDHAKVFAASMAKELITDTTQLRLYRDDMNFAANNIDTFMQLLSEADPKNASSGKLYWYGLFGSMPRYFIPNDATFQQMKSSGALRFFKKDVANDATRYDRSCRILEDWEQKNQGIYTEGRKTKALLFDFKYLEAANILSRTNKIPGNWQRVDSFINSNPPLLSTDKIIFNQYVELSRSRFLHHNVSFADSALKQASILLADLKKEYHLENE